MKNKKTTGVLKRIIDNRDENLLKEQEHRIDLLINLFEQIKKSTKLENKDILKLLQEENINSLDLIFDKNVDEKYCEDLKNKILKYDKN